MKKLSELLRHNPFLSIAPITDDFVVRGITSNSKRCEKDFIFIATKGAGRNSKDGHSFIAEAQARGARIIIVESDYPSSGGFIRASDSKKALCHLLEAFYGSPSAALNLIGITGTNGKTSTSFMMHHILHTAGYKPKIMGTLGMGDPQALTPLSHTTMEPEFISKTLAAMRDDGVTHVIMEVSSHALALKRVEALSFAAVGLTNITQDHLDFHETLERYQQAKARLFNDIAHKTTIQVLPTAHQTLACATENLTIYGPHEPAYSYAVVDMHADSLDVTLTIDGQLHKLALPLLGHFHASNACLAATICKKQGISDEHIIAGLKSCPAIAGRLQLVKNTHNRLIFIDYAHTPDALSALLTSARLLEKGRIIIVFGCGGDRDQEKRPLMGAIAEKLADELIITDDNPRTEDPAAIRKAILSGIKHKKPQMIADRREAIRHAILSAKQNDIVIIAGKGHENYQIYGTTMHEFSDYNEAKIIVDAL